MDWLERERAVLGDAALEKLKNTRAAVVGLGGVGGSAAEALVRSGVGAILLVDFDVVEPTNKNRQLLALDTTVGRLKTEAALERYHQINPACELIVLNARICADNIIGVFDFDPDFVIDAVDSVTAKLLLAEGCAQRGIPLISCMGTGNRLDPTRLKIGTAADTAGSACPLARVMRRELKKRGLLCTTVLYSDEPPVTPADGIKVGSVAWVPPAAGCALAGYMIREILKQEA